LVRLLTDRRGLNFEPRHVLLSGRVDGCLIDEAEATEFTQARQGNVVPHALSDEDSELFAVLGQIADAQSCRNRRTGDTDLTTVDLHNARGQWIGSNDRSRGFGSAGPHQSCQPQDLTAAQVEADIAQLRPGPQVLHFENRLLRAAIARNLVHCIELASNHHPNDLRHLGGGRLHRADLLSVADDRDELGDRFEFRHTVLMLEDPRLRRYELMYLSLE